MKRQVFSDSLEEDLSEKVREELLEGRKVAAGTVDTCSVDATGLRLEPAVTQCFQKSLIRMPPSCLLEQGRLWQCATDQTERSISENPQGIGAAFWLALLVLSWQGVIWPHPQNLPRINLAVEAFNLRTLPENLRDFLGLSRPDFYAQAPHDMHPCKRGSVAEAGLECMVSTRHGWQHPCNACGACL